MSNKLLDQFRQQEADTIALSVKFNRWSLVMIETLIQEEEEKLMASDQPVDGEAAPARLARPKATLAGLLAHGKRKAPPAAGARPGDTKKKETKQENEYDFFPPPA